MSKKNNKNSFKHGVYAKDIVLPNESAEEFEQLRQEFRLQFNPIGAQGLEPTSLYKRSSPFSRARHPRSGRKF
jgi:hypothetical protein